jgi:hypothetical protein
MTVIYFFIGVEGFVQCVFKHFLDLCASEICCSVDQCLETEILRIAVIFFNNHVEDFFALFLTADLRAVLFFATFLALDLRATDFFATFLALFFAADFLAVFLTAT